MRSAAIRCRGPQSDQRLVAAGTMIAIIPVLVLFAIFQRQFFRGVGQAAVKG